MNDLSPLRLGEGPRNLKIIHLCWASGVHHLSWITHGCAVAAKIENGYGFIEPESRRAAFDAVENVIKLALDTMQRMPECMEIAWFREMRLAAKLSELQLPSPLRDHDDDVLRDKARKFCKTAAWETFGALTMLLLDDLNMPIPEVSLHQVEPISMTPGEAEIYISKKCPWLEESYCHSLPSKSLRAPECRTQDGARIYKTAVDKLVAKKTNLNAIRSRKAAGN